MTIGQGNGNILNGHGPTVFRAALTAILAALAIGAWQLRITKSTARYDDDAGFTPPSPPFPTS